jgi:hypothetical protein
MSQDAWHVEVLPAAQAALLPELSRLPRHFVLHGGTALALRLGHRASIDFTFFSARPFAPDRLQPALPVRGAVLQKGENTLSLLTEAGVHLSFFGGLTFGRIHPPHSLDGIPFASLDDLFATKLNVIHQRAEAKDYLEIAALIRSGHSLERGLGCALAVYGELFNYLLPLKALAYFEEPSLASLPEAAKSVLLDAVQRAGEPERITQDSPSIDPVPGDNPG